MSSRCWSIAIGLGFLVQAQPALAQAPRNLTEQDVVATAVSSNPSLHVALLRAQQSRYTLSAEEALYTPLFDANAAYTHGRTPTLFGPSGVRVTGSDVVDLGAGISKPFAYGTVLSATVAGQRSSRTTLVSARPSSNECLGAQPSPRSFVASIE